MTTLEILGLPGGVYPVDGPPPTCCAGQACCLTG
jgi:hypothetical protein